MPRKFFVCGAVFGLVAGLFVGVSLNASAVGHPTAPVGTRVTGPTVYFNSNTLTHLVEVQSNFNPVEITSLTLPRGRYELTAQVNVSGSTGDSTTAIPHCQIVRGATVGSGSVQYTSAAAWQADVHGLAATLTLATPANVSSNRVTLYCSTNSTQPIRYGAILQAMTLSRIYGQS